MKIGNLLCGTLLAGILIGGSISCPAAAGLTNYLWKFDASCSSLATTVSGVVTLTGTHGGTLSYEFVELGGGAPELNDAFPPIQASAANTAIVVTVPAISSGGACVVCAFCSQQ